LVNDHTEYGAPGYRYQRFGLGIGEGA